MAAAGGDRPFDLAAQVAGVTARGDRLNSPVRHGATLAGVPTAHPRHTITETPPVREALDELRARLHGERIDYAELVVLGARMKARQLPDDAQAAHEAAGRLAEMIRRRSIPVDIEAADAAKHPGLIAD